MDRFDQEYIDRLEKLIREETHGGRVVKVDTNLYSRLRPIFFPSLSYNFDGNGARPDLLDIHEIHYKGKILIPEWIQEYA